MSWAPDRIGSQNNSRPSATLAGVDGLSGGDSTWSGSGANGVAGCARIDSVRLTTVMDAVTARARRPAPLPLSTPIVTSLRRCSIYFGDPDPWMATTGLRGQANRLCLQALSDEARQAPSSRAR